MSIYIYMVRYGELLKLEGNERMCGLIERGYMDVCRVIDILKVERIDIFIFSFYNWVMLMIEELVNFYEKEIVVYENFKECMFLSED